MLRSLTFNRLYFVLNNQEPEIRMLGTRLRENDPRLSKGLELTRQGRALKNRWKKNQKYNYLKN